jgi:putative tricarboxylic transport membrane protein
MMSDRILGALAMLVAGAMTIASWNYAAPVDYEPVGPRAFPLLLALLMALCGAWLVARPAHDAFGRHEPLHKIALTAGAILVYAILFQVLGFVVATALMCVPVGLVFGGNLRQCAVLGAGMGIGLYVFFDKLLDVVLPLGMLKPVFTLLGM